MPGLDRCSRSERSLQPEGALPPMPWSADRCRIRGSSGYIVRCIDASGWSVLGKRL